MVKNFSTKSLFFSRKTVEKFGKVNRFISFPLINLIFIEYKKKRDAMVAFSKFSISLKREGVFLEWAPYNCIKKEKKKTVQKKKTQSKENLTEFKLKKRELLLGDKNKKKILKTKKISFLRNQLFLHESPMFSKRKFTLLIRNIPFHASLWDLRKIFSPLGGILSIRMPKKKDGAFRGFAFITFCSLEETKKALLLTQRIHIYSRRLFPSIIA